MRRALAFAHSLALLGCTGVTCPAADLGPLEAPARLAVVSSDYASSAVGLLGDDDALVTEAWLDSGSVTPRIVAALSGDVVLPSAPLDACRLAVIDRLGTDVITFLDPCAGVVRGQLDVGPTFRSNPQDVLLLPDGRALVSRSERNADPAAAPNERGNDLLIVDPAAPRILGRLDLSVADAGEALARPWGMARLERGGLARVVVGLARLSARFTEVGPGAVAVVDVESGGVEALELGALASCDDVDRVPGEPARALVRCGGRPFEDAAGRRGSVGLVLLELGEDGALTEVARWTAAQHPDEPVYDTAAVPLGGTRVAVTARGDLVAGVNDRVAILDLEDGAVTELFEARSAFVIGEGALDGTRLYLPDAHLGAVRRFELGEGTALALEPVPTAPCRGLPPREVRRI